MKKHAYVILLITLIFVLLRIFSSLSKSSVYILGNSMLPTLKPGQTAAFSAEETIEYGDVILLKTSDHKTIVKRVIGLSGDIIHIIGGQVYRNGQALIEEYALLEESNFGPITVPDGYLFILGDNRAHSKDSRQIGCISIDAYQGTLILPE